MSRHLANLITLALLSAAALVAATTPAAAAGCVTIPAVAHRGGTEHFTENSRNAFRDAGNLGVKLWETDVQFTADDEPVIMHDDTVDRTTNGTGPVSGFTAAEYTAVDTDDDEPAPTLRELVNDAAVDGAKVLVELKTMPTEAQWTTFLAALGSRPIPGQIVVTSFDGPTLLALQAHTTAYATGLIAELGDQTAASVTQYGAHILIKHHNAITAARMAAWTAGGLTVYSWTVDSVSEMDRMSWYPALGGVITNLPSAYLTWQRGRAC